MAGRTLRHIGAPLFAATLFMMGVVNADAQEPHTTRGWGAGYLAAGASAIATGPLDDRLNSRSYPTFGSTATVLGIGGYLILPRGFVLGGEANGLIIGEEAHDGRRVGLGGGYATIGLGYAVELSPRVRIYPRLGIGVGGLGMWIETTREPVGFDDVLANPEQRAEESVRPPSMGVDGAVVDIGAGAEFWPYGRGLLIGLRVGYLATPSSWDWSQNGRTVSDGPAATIAGPYVRVAFGAGPWW